MKDYGKALKNTRLYYGYSTNDIFKATGISTANISRWETNKVLPNIYFIEKLADFYNITIDELIDRQ